MIDQKFPPGWDEARVQRLIAHYDAMNDDEMIAEDEAAQEVKGKTLHMTCRIVPKLILATVLLIYSGCTDSKPSMQESTSNQTAQAKNPQEVNVPKQPEQKISNLTPADEKRMEDQRAVIKRFVGSEDSKRKYETAAGKLGTIRAILQGKFFKPDQTYELQCLGIVLGDALVQEMKMEWIMVEDEYGRDPAVRMPGTTIILFPLTMISKRIERGEQVDVFDLFNSSVDQIEAIQRKGM